MGSMSTHDAEAWLAARLQEHGVDIYAGGEFPTLRDRLAHAIVSSGSQATVVGRHEGKPETYEQFVLRVFGISLKDLEKPHSSRARKMGGAP
jgi:hypothetical protein